MDIPKFIRPVSADIVDGLVRANEGPWTQMDKDGLAHVKVLWTSSQSGGWAVLYRWQKGYRAPAHKHLGAIHAYIISGSLKIGENVLGAGDYTYEANGMVHGETEALEDTLHINIADGPLVFFDDKGLTTYVGWEQIWRMDQRAKHSES